MISRTLGSPWFVGRLFLLYCSCFIHEVSAQGPRDARIYSALVSVEISGSDSYGVMHAELATGFVISRFGHVLTTSHVLDDLGNVNPMTVIIKLTTGTTSISQPLSAVTFKDKLLDVMVLQLPTPLADRQYLCFLTKKDTDSILFNETKIYISGYTNEGYYADNGIINSFGGAGNTWLTSLHIYSGMSGSPIYTAAGQIIGMAKAAKQRFEGLYALIPINNIRAQIMNFGSECTIKNVNESIKVATSPEIEDAIKTATSTLPTPTECVMLGKLSAIRTKKPNDAPFGVDVISMLKSNNVSKESFSVKAATEVNVRDTCPVVRGRKAYYGKINRELNVGQMLTISSYRAVPVAGDTFYWGLIASH